MCLCGECVYLVWSEEIINIVNKLIIKKVLWIIILFLSSI